MFELLLSYYPANRYYPAFSDNKSQMETGDIIFLVVGLGLLIGGVIWFFYKDVLKGGGDDSLWAKGIIPKTFVNTPENVFELFIAAGAAMIVRDPANYAGKVPRMAAYLKSQMPEQYYEFSESVSYSLKHVVKLDSLAKWVNRYFSPVQRLQLANFMTYLAICDGELTHSEKAYLFSLFQKIGVKLSELESVYQTYFATTSNKRSKSSTPARSSDYEVLGLEANATQEEIKLAYRALVKMTHPDRFMQESEAVREEMAKKFREIQQAYENLTK